MSLALQYLFQDNCNDSIGNHHGTATSIAYEDLPEDMNIGGKAALFNGSSSVINIATTVSGLTKFTVEFWYYPRQSYYSNIAAMFVAYSSGDGYPMIDMTQTTNAYPSQFFVRTISINPFKLAQKIYTLTLNTWQHLVVTWESSTIKSYINGVLKDTMTDPTTMSGLPTYVQRIGKGWQSGDGVCINGKIANFRIWNEALSETEVASHYAIESVPPPSRGFNKVLVTWSEKSLSEFNNARRVNHKEEIWH